MTLRRPVRCLLIAAIVILASCLGDIVYNRLWWDHAEAAINETVSAAAKGQSPKSIVASVDTAAVISDFALPYAIVGADNELGGSSLVDLMSPGVYVAILHFTNGREYDVEAAREEGGIWHVSISLRP